MTMLSLNNSATIPIFTVFLHNQINNFMMRTIKALTACNALLAPSEALSFKIFYEWWSGGGSDYLSVLHSKVSQCAQLMSRHVFLPLPLPTLQLECWQPTMQKSGEEEWGLASPSFPPLSPPVTKQICNHSSPPDNFLPSRFQSQFKEKQVVENRKVISTQTNGRIITLDTGLICILGCVCNDSWLIISCITGDNIIGDPVRSNRKSKKFHLTTC